MEYEKHTMGKGRKRKLGESELSEDAASGKGSIYKWKRERKK